METDAGFQSVRLRREHQQEHGQDRRYVKGVQIHHQCFRSTEAQTEVAGPLDFTIDTDL